MNHDDREQHQVILSNNKIGNHNAFVALVPIITVWGGFAFILLLLGMGIFAATDLKGFLPFMSWLFKGTLYATGATIVLLLITKIVTFCEHHARHRIDIAEQAARVDFAQAIAEAIRAGISDGSNVKVSPDGGVELVRFTGTGRVTINEAPEVLPQLPSPHVIRQPSMRFLMNELEEGGLQVCPGVRADTGDLVILLLEDAVHFKLIGSSGFGKSCLAAALLEQAITLNGPDLLQIALLDLEHKTSRLFEDSPSVATLQVGRRAVPMVATNADEVATYLGYLKGELDRRARHSETDLLAEPILLMYVEEMLSLQYEVDEKLLHRMLADLSVLAVRARKYRMFLLACAQTDYSTPELKTAQKQFRTRIAYAIDTTAARAAGFMSTDLIKQNFANSQKGDGQFVLEAPGIASLMLAPVYDVKQKLLARERSARASPAFQDRFTGISGVAVKTDETPSQADFQAKVHELRELGWGKVAIIEKVWNVKAGGTAAYKNACAEYERIVPGEEA